jgi:hypothetical protein
MSLSGTAADRVLLKRIAKAYEAGTLQIDGVPV